MALLLTQAPRGLWSEAAPSERGGCGRAAVPGGAGDGGGRARRYHLMMSWTSGRKENSSCAGGSGGGFCSTGGSGGGCSSAARPAGPDAMAGPAVTERGGPGLAPPHGPGARGERPQPAWSRPGPR